MLPLMAPAVALSEQSVSFGEYTVHYNALTTDLIEPVVARAYGIVRSKRRALINVAVLRKIMGTAAQPIKADVSATATNLSDQLQTIDIRELVDDGAIYYIGELPVDHAETLNFTLEVTPEGAATGYTIEFRQEFFTR
jgi:hypothetical protein